jgi:DNA-binding NarL/FixJ family response regulator
MTTSPRPPLRVLIADDAVAVRQRLAAMLDEIPDVQVCGQAGSVNETVVAVARLHPEVLLLDLNMPGGSGLDVLQAVRARTEALVVIVLTNYPYPEYEKRARELGADAFYDKSRNFLDAVEYIRELAASLDRHGGEVVS